MTDFPPNPPPARPPYQGWRPPAGMLPSQSVGLKLMLVCGLALLMAIPAIFVYGIVVERSSGAEAAMMDVSERVGGEQTVLGPVLALPYSFAPDPDKPDSVTYGVALAYAETGTANADISVQERQRGIHLVPVFKADMTFEARFDPEALRGAVPEGGAPIWNDARLYVGVSDNRGISDSIDIVANGSPVALEPVAHGYASDGAYNPVPRTDLSLAAGRIRNLQNLRTPFDVRAQMVVTGARRFAIGPFAKTTGFSMVSDWAAPSFTGGTLPSTHNVGASEDGFEAQWRLPYLARGIAGSGPRLDLYPVTQNGYRDMAVRFVHAANPYQSVQRALKYGTLFIGLVFLSYFLFEITSGLRAHPAQYVLVGLAQSIFYLLLLAFSEQIGFDAAFAISASMTVLLISAYAISVFKSRKYGFRAFGILTGIYTLIYVLMRAEGNALLAGAVASFVAIGVTMYLTRDVDWYGGRPAQTV